MRLETFRLNAGQAPSPDRALQRSDASLEKRGFTPDVISVVKTWLVEKRCGKRSARLGAGQALQRCSGQATLSFILLVSGVVLEVAVAGSFVTYFLNSAGFGERLSARALAAAQAGVGDATLQVVRNKEFVTAGTAAYTFAVGSDTASVSISRTIDSAANTYLYTITVTGVAGTRERRLTARMAVNQTTGLAELQEVREQSVD